MMSAAFSGKLFYVCDILGKANFVSMAFLIRLCFVSGLLGKAVIWKWPS